MNRNTKRIIYWAATVLFALWIIGAGIGDLMHGQTVVTIFMRLGYPLYVLTILGVAKILGGIGVVQTRSRTLKEWAFAGYTFDCLGASASHYFGGDTIGWILLPLGFLILMFIPYTLWKLGWGR